jgi:hypothetical protein
MVIVKQKLSEFLENIPVVFREILSEVTSPAYKMEFCTLRLFYAMGQADLRGLELSGL